MSGDPVSTTLNPVFIQQAERLCEGGELLPGGLTTLASRLQQSVASCQPLRVKLGLDPTRPDLHLGHSVVLRKLRLFQDLGHQAVLLIGDATALIGDPSGRNQTRPPLTQEEVAVNAETYLNQAGRIIDVHKAEIVHNHHWFGEFRLTELLALTAKVTIAQLLARDDFAKRYSQEKPIFLHELIYPLMQGYDSVAIRADIELGGTDQRFNNLMGRELQVVYGSSAEQLVLLMPLLEGTDGIVKMSKSYPEHCINLTDTPDTMFGKLMSIPDSLLSRYQQLLTPMTQDQIAEQSSRFHLPEAAGGLNPRHIKSMLAKWIISQYHGPQEAEEAEHRFNSQFRDKAVPEDIPEAPLPEPSDLIRVMVSHGLAPSNAEARRLIQGGGVRLNGEKIENVAYQVTVAPGQTQVLQVGKRRFLRLLG